MARKKSQAERDLEEARKVKKDLENGILGRHPKSRPHKAY